MGLGDWLGWQGIHDVIALPGAAPNGLGAARTVAAPDAQCAWALAAAEGTMRSGLAAVWTARCSPSSRVPWTRSHRRHPSPRARSTRSPRR
ncbi:hypothetical protein FAGKG844_270021 [Frankia sp. AgKG'84/4]